MKREKRITLIMGALATCVVVYLIWWNTEYVHSGMFESLIWIDIIAFMSFGVLGLLTVVAMVLTFRSWIYVLSIIPAFLLLIYLSNIWHGPKVAELRECDLSECSELIFYADGSFYFEKRSQAKTLRFSGVVREEGDTLRLMTCFHWSLDWGRLTKETFEHRKAIQPVGFSFTYADQFDK